MKITLQDIFSLSSSVIYNPDGFKSISNVIIDSRSIKKNSLFVAIKGKKFDGHQFVEQAVAKGASAVLISKRKLKDFNHLDIPVIAVTNTTNAYGELANIYRHKNNFVVVSITGSNGKTSTKEFLSTILSEKYKVYKTLANNNNHIGVPLSILSAPKSAEVLVLEHGTNHFNEIEFTAKIAEPDFSLITNIADTHLQYLIDRAGVLKEKKSLFDYTSANGKVFVNTDDVLLKGIKKNYKNATTYGFKGNVDYKGFIRSYTKYGNTVLEVVDKKKTVKQTLPVYGEGNAQNILASVALASELGLNKKQIVAGIKKLRPVDNRLNITDENNTLVIKDYYNASPASMIDSINLLKNVTVYKRKILLLGDMFELGENSNSYHAQLAKHINKNDFNEILLIGKMMTALYDELKMGIVKHHFKNRKTLIKYLSELDIAKTSILIKGSRGMKMEEFAETVLTKRN